MDGADTIVVGAGSAGAVIAARMTENSANQVLLIEAGPDYVDLQKLPRDLVDGTRNSQHTHDWGYAHNPSATAPKLPLPRGRLVGGSSAVNTCIGLRGPPEDYEEWAALGLPDWKWDACLPAFKRLEDDRDFENAWHGRGGPVPLRRHPRAELTPWQGAFMDACGEAGHTPCADTNDPTLHGFGPHAMNKLDGVRQSAARCYLTPAVRARPNLRISADTLVHRVLIENGRAVGLDIERNGTRERVLGKRVVLCGGAVATPGILLRSGLGSRANVERLGVELVREVPNVGERMLDYPGVAIFFWPKYRIDKSAPLIQNVLRFTSSAKPVPNDIQVQPGSFIPTKYMNFRFTTVSVCVGKPVGTGTITFTSRDPRAAPKIEMKFFEDARDRQMAREGIERIADLASRPALRALGTPVFPRRGLEARDENIRKWCMSAFHPSGTVPMGPGGACDGRGRVHGIEGLIVADASLMPTIPSANTNLPTLMIGERFGEWLRDGQI